MAERRETAEQPVRRAENAAPTGEPVGPGLDQREESSRPRGVDEERWALALTFLERVVREPNLTEAAKNLLTEFDYRDLQRARDTIGAEMEPKVWEEVMARIALFKAKRMLR